MGGSGKKGLSVEEVIELSRALEKINGISLDRLQAEKIEALRPVDRLVKDLEDGVKVVRGPKRPKKVHYKVRRRKWREYYHRVKKRQRAEEKIEMLRTPEGWFRYVTLIWDRKGIDHFTETEWLEVIWPVLEGRVPFFTRYSTKKGYTLDNLVVWESGTKNVIFDGKEHYLRSMGYIL